MPHPLESHSPGARARATRWTFVAFLITTAIIGAIDQKLRTPASPHGIVSFELAGSPGAAQSVLDAWSASIGVTVWAALQTGFDYLYLCVYGLLFSLVCAGLTVRLVERRPSLAGVARAVTWLQLVAVLCDASENVALVAMITRVGTDPYAALATGFALGKFACLAMALVFMPLAWLLTRAPAPAEG